MPFSGPLDERQLISELIADYCDAVNRRDAVAWGATWDEDGVSDLPFLGIDGMRGRANIVSTWKQAMALFSFAHMMAQAGRIEVDGDRALVRCYTSEVTVLADSGAERRPAVCMRMSASSAAGVGCFKAAPSTSSTERRSGDRGVASQ